MNEKELGNVAVKSGIWYTVGNILLKSCVFLSLPIFTRLLSTTDFGIYNTYIAYEGILTAILGLGLYGTVKNAKIDFKEKFDEYLSSVLSLSIIVLFIVIALANIFYEAFAIKIGFSRLIVNCMILQSFGSYLIYFYGSKLNIEFKYKSYIILSFFNTLGNIFLSIILVLFVFPNQRYLGRIIGSAIPLILIALVVSVYILFKGKKIFNKKYWKYAITIGIPLVPHVISQSLLSQFDRIMINNMVGPSESGIYSYIYTICTIMYVICSSFDSAWTSWVYMTLKDGKKENVKTAAKNYVYLFALLTLGFICIMPEVTKIIASKEYWSGIDLLIPLTLSNYFIYLYMIPVGIEYYNKKTKYISLGTMSAAILNLILNLFAIKFIGYKAAAYTTLISYILLFIFHWTISKKFSINDIYDINNISKITLILIGISLSILILEFFKIQFIEIIYRYIIIIVIIILLWERKDILLELLKRKVN